MLEDLRRGNPEIAVTLLVATGCHRGTTAGELRAKLGDAPIKTVYGLGYTWEIQ